MDARWMLGDALTGLAFQQAAVGDWPAGMASLRECITVFKELDNDLGLEMALESYAGFAAWAGEFELTAIFLGKTDEMRERMGGGRPTFFLGAEPFWERTRNALEVATYEQLYAEGRQLTTTEELKLADDFEVPPGTPPVALPAPPRVARAASRLPDAATGTKRPPRRKLERSFPLKRRNLTGGQVPEGVLLRTGTP